MSIYTPISVIKEAFLYNVENQEASSESMLHIQLEQQHEDQGKLYDVIMVMSSADGKVLEMRYTFNRSLEEAKIDGWHLLNSVDKWQQDSEYKVNVESKLRML